MQSTSPPRPSARALRSVMTPREVETIATPSPFMTPGECAAVAQPHGRGVARQLLQLGARLFARLVRGAAVVDDVEQRGALRLELLDGLATFLVAQFHCQLGHESLFSA